MSVRPTAPYRLVGVQSGDGAAPDTRELLRTCSLYRMPHSGRQGAVLVHETKEGITAGRITECRQNIGRIIEFTQDKRFDSRFKDLKKDYKYFYT